MVWLGARLGLGWMDVMGMDGWMDGGMEGGFFGMC